MTKPRFILGWVPPSDTEEEGGVPLKRFLANRVKMVFGDPHGMNNYMTYRDAIQILGMDPQEIYRDGRIDLDPHEWADLGWLCSHIGPPESALAAMREHISAANVGPYSPDLIAPLRDVVAREKFGRERGDDFEVIGTEGAQAGVGYAMLTFVNPGDEVIVTDPGYFHFIPAIHMAGGSPVKINLTRENHYRLDPDEVGRRVTLRTKMIVICDPINPFGTVQTKEELVEIAKIARKHDILVLDNITHNTYQVDPNASQYPMASLFDETDTDHIISTFGMSHGYGMAAVRLGFLAGHPLLMRACLATKIAVTRLNTNLLAQYGSLAALQDKGYLHRSREIIRRNYAHLKESVARTPGLSIPVNPQYGFSAVIDISGTGVTAQELTVALFKRRVAVYPSDGLGDVGATEYLRVNFSRPDLWAFEQLRAALPDAIAEAQTGAYLEAVREFFTRRRTERGQRIIAQLEASRGASSSQSWQDRP